MPDLSAVFIGRETEIQWFLEGFGENPPKFTARLVTASSGLGKTALLHEIARRFGKRGRMRLCFLEAVKSRSRWHTRRSLRCWKSWAGGWCPCPAKNAFFWFRGTLPFWRVFFLNWRNSRG